jgi:adenine phosphoribosyltransferase
METLKGLIRHVPDFPKAGILFYDITTLLGNKKGFCQAVSCFVDRYRAMKIDRVIGIESRGFIFGSAVADRLEVGFVPVRKPGKLPGQTISASYDLEYGTDTLEIHEDAIKEGERIVIVDDLLATGGTASAAIDLVRRSGGIILELAVLIELKQLNGRLRLGSEKVFSILQY